MIQRLDWARVIRELPTMAEIGHAGCLWCDPVAAGLAAISCSVCLYAHGMVTKQVFLTFYV